MMVLAGYRRLFQTAGATRSTSTLCAGSSESYCLNRTTKKQLEANMSESAPARTLTFGRISKTYSIPISNGILEHREQIGSAIWLFLLLIDWTTSERNGIGTVRGGKPIKLKDLMSALGLKERQVSTQLQRLKAGGYIQARRTPYGYVIEVMKSKKFVNRDQQKTADHYTSDQHKSADHKNETSNNLQQRSATS